MSIPEIRRPLSALLTLLTLSAAAQAALPPNIDSDGDGLSDTDEINIHATLPLNRDTDGDRIYDSDEINIYGTNPLDPDTDGDGLTDFAEAVILGDPAFNADPLNPDTNSDGSPDGDTDYDGDGLTAAQELYITSMASFSETPTSDFDGDGISNGDELFVYGTDPSTPDTDRDRLSDSDELFIHFTDPLVRDTDGDGIIDGDELQLCNTNPAQPDTCPCDQPTIQVHLVLDSELVQRFGPATEDYARAAFEAAEVSWNNPVSNGGPGIRIRLVDVTTITSGPNPWVSTYSSPDLLFNFTNWSQAVLPVDAPVRDVVMLLTGNGLQTGIGLAWVGQVGSPNGVGHVSVLGDILKDGTTMSHQLGHIMGADHNGQGNSCPSFGFVMSGTSGNFIPTSFSQCSIDDFQNTLSMPGIAEALAPDCPAPPCPADTNGDGVLDNGDIGFFVGLFLDGDTAADMNGDGILDNGDINTFVSLFLAGC